MLRDGDNDPSFAVDDQLGVWFDHGTGKGGNIIDFGLSFWPNLGFKEVVIRLQEKCLMSQTVLPPVRQRLSIRVPYYVVEQVKPLGTHPAVTNYLKSRGIFSVANTGMSEVYYYLENDKGERRHYFSAAWKNDLGGWEVRNRYFKGCLGHKAITSIQGHPKKVALFEGYINFLSWRLEHPEADPSIIVLNTITMLGVAKQKAIGFSEIDIFFDRDKQGMLATKELIKCLPYASDRSMVYEGYNDYNDKIKSLMSSKSKVTERGFAERTGIFLRR
ncbi:MAG TPA: toprim domain-containing protein, partial [Mucilaginibacter sp.]